MFALMPISTISGKEAEKPRQQQQQPDIIPYEQWHCGASAIDKSLSHQMLSNDCPNRMYEADLCCVVHDICYMEEGQSQHDCDTAFCYCLERTVTNAAAARSVNSTTPTNGCGSVANSFCELVQLFGGIAYSASRQTLAKQKAAMVAWEEAEMATKRAKQLEMAPKKNGSTSISTQMSTTTETTTTTTTTTAAASMPTLSAAPPSSTTRLTTPTTTTSTFISSRTPSSIATTASPSQIGKFITHRFPLTCFDGTLSKCTQQLHQCTSEQFNAVGNTGQERDALLFSAQLAECSAKFCECTGANVALSKQANSTDTNVEDECAHSLAAICTQFVDFPAQQHKASSNVNILSVSVTNFGQPISLGLAMVGTLLVLFSLTVSGLLLTKFIRLMQRHFFGDESIRKNYAKSSIRRNALTATIRKHNNNGDDDDDDDVDVERGPHYISLGHHQKDSTVSNPSDSGLTTPSGAHQTLLTNMCPATASSSHHHKKAHSDTPHHLKSNNNNNNMPLNSSQVHLITAGIGNQSSSSLSDDMSST